MTRFITSPAIESSGNFWNAKKIDFDGDVISLTPTASTEKIAFVGLNTGLTIIAFWSTYSSGDDFYPIGSATVGEGIASSQDANYYKYYLPAGTLKNLTAGLKSTPNEGVVTLTIYKNGEPTALTVSADPPTYEPVAVSDTTNEVSVSDGDYICVHIVGTLFVGIGSLSVYLEFYRS